MSLDIKIKQCCDTDPLWIFIYQNGTAYGVCDADFKNPVYRSGIEKIVNIKSQKIFTPKEIFKEDN